jgi:hypothetical protein
MALSRAVPDRVIFRDMNGGDVVEAAPPSEVFEARAARVILGQSFTH